MQPDNFGRRPSADEKNPGWDKNGFSKIDSQKWIQTKVSISTEKSPRL